MIYNDSNQATQELAVVSAGTAITNANIKAEYDKVLQQYQQ
jgi:hypothetical protein